MAVDPAEYQLAIADRRFVWGIEKDELDVLYMVRYRVVRQR